MCLGLLPQLHQFRLGVCGKRLVRLGFHIPEALVKFVAGPVQGILRVHPGHLGHLGGNEQGVAHFLPHAVRRVGSLTGLESRTQLPYLLFQLAQGAQGAGPDMGGAGAGTGASGEAGYGDDVVDADYKEV